MSITRRSALAVPALVVLPAVRRAAEAAARDTPLSDDRYAHPDWLVSADWLKRHLDDSAVRVVALTPVADFTTRHIPGAAQIDWPDLEILDTSQASVAKWQAAVEQKLRHLGISPRDTVVAYDGGTLFAARMWWVLDHLGQHDKRILNGGLAAWDAAGGGVGHGIHVPKPASPYKGTPNPADLATLDQVKASLGKPGITLIDARSRAEYIRGHIPGALNIDYPKNALPNAPHFWEPAAILRRLYASAGATPNKEIIPYCSTGVRSAVTYFALRLIGYPDVRLYTGSWAEWSRHPDLPKTEGDRP